MSSSTTPDGAGPGASPSVQTLRRDLQSMRAKAINLIEALLERSHYYHHHSPDSAMVQPVVIPLATATADDSGGGGGGDSLVINGDDKIRLSHRLDSSHDPRRYGQISPESSARIAEVDSRTRPPAHSHGDIGQAGTPDSYSPPESLFECPDIYERMAVNQESPSGARQASSAYEDSPILRDHYHRHRPPSQDVLPRRLPQPPSSPLLLSPTSRTPLGPQPYAETIEEFDRLENILDDLYQGDSLPTQHSGGTPPHHWRQRAHIGVKLSKHDDNDRMSRDSGNAGGTPRRNHIRIWRASDSDATHCVKAEVGLWFPAETDAAGPATLGGTACTPKRYSTGQGDMLPFTRTPSEASDSPTQQPAYSQGSSNGMSGGVYPRGSTQASRDGLGTPLSPARGPLSSGSKLDTTRRRLIWERLEEDAAQMQDLCDKVKAMMLLAPENDLTSGSNRESSGESEHGEGSGARQPMENADPDTGPTNRHLRSPGHRAQLLRALEDRCSQLLALAGPVIREHYTASGKLVREYAGDQIFHVYPDGNVKHQQGDGRSTIYYSNGDIEVRDTARGFTKYTYAADGCTHTTFESGSEELVYPDGRIEYRGRDGSCQVHYPDGTVRVYSDHAA
ncbi:hypothetical protein EV182_001202 [Spiromyces aspiralis]|uniref:Uncharacterized protein n=1 Tax=Spiromyces aspiralis TaxID=68401 RepID=A0ACC1HFT4_9FUNG|nr:hypothetical protein EV182_001202 [Spiromyces aspiralis]